MTKAMLKQLAPKARMPPSPKSRAWMKSATLTAMQAAQGPSSAATRVPPTAWPVVPPGRGTLNIMMRKEKAAPMPRSGICARETSACTFRTETAQTGTIAAPMTAQVAGLR